MNRCPYVAVRIIAERPDRTRSSAVLVLETDNGKLAAYLDTDAHEQRAAVVPQLAELFRLPVSAFAVHDHDLRVRSREIRNYRRLAGIRSLPGSGTREE